MPDSVILKNKISYGSVFRITYMTLVSGGVTGYGKRNEMRSIPILKGDLSYGVQDQDDLDDLIETFHAARGQKEWFLVKDWSDWHTRGGSVNASIGFHDQTIVASALGGETTAQLIKTYATGTLSTVRTIRKPKAGTVRIGRRPAASSVWEELTITTDWSLDATTGVVTLVSALSSGAALAWGGEYYVPMRFEQDDIAIRLSHFEIGDTGVAVTEVLED